ncbi:MAG: hypothetical protein IPO90_07370 [Flavobacteriales bacterium]|nr:hypothetical protein [Flavobacteriales bacterium]
MSTYTLQLAFKRMLTTPQVWRKLHVGRQTVMNRRVLLGKGKYPRDATMRSWLKKAGWKQAVVEKWRP